MKKKLLGQWKVNNIPNVLFRCGNEHIEDDTNEFLLLVSTK